ncbi:hypothetical protein SPRG_04429 [Saprolegnia parasitica CBS 223.65]|uniref:Uncharacterized protein n=1 Tax=Saprolegnia parasitica (strain CBS 223.65) TaxID=695850 RepID=A0A067CJ17_SAPPC|nr:hypothetical protein SPRG_04429 [Saprolegnia parasitica CBS 223.65]KDO30528.1 hypothetical protein SPRG_04429 [Saprolegnia parasitica CBS 223.65]|eukprot:XP_012198743.1 hypothetical protein SPRG_04429 [Saprolegnia parasitica CBS 223.65]
MHKRAHCFPREADLDGRVKALQKTKPAAIDLFAPDATRHFYKASDALDEEARRLAKRKKTLHLENGGTSLACCVALAYAEET